MVRSVTPKVWPSRRPLINRRVRPQDTAAMLVHARTLPPIRCGLGFPIPFVPPLSGWYYSVVPCPCEPPESIMITPEPHACCCAAIVPAIFRIAPAFPACNAPDLCRRFSSRVLRSPSALQPPTFSLSHSFYSAPSALKPSPRYGRHPYPISLQSPPRNQVPVVTDVKKHPH